MSPYALHPGAFADLEEIRAYLAADSPDAADRVVSEIFERIRDLVRFPHQGFRRSNLTSRPVRFVLQRDYLIAYVPDRRPLWVLAVFSRPPGAKSHQGAPAIAAVTLTPPSPRHPPRSSDR